MYLVLLCLFWISKSCARNETDYCKINKDHILCGADVPPSNFSNILRYLPKTKEDREDLLHLINKMRNHAASGRHRVGSVHFPMAGNMFELEWCEICEKAALNHLKRCNSKSFRSCCNCMNTGEMDLFSVTLEEFIVDAKDYHFNLTSIVKHFNRYYESEYIPFDCVRNMTHLCLRGGSGFHFSLMNARQVKIGCAFGECKRSGEKKVFGILTCITNLNFELDINGKYHYTSGEPGSQCPKPYSSPSKNKEYPKLCKCRNITGCLIKPAELSSECTTRKGASSTTIPTTKQFLGTKPLDFGQLMNEGINEISIIPTIATKTTKKTTKAVTGSGGGGDAAGVKRLEDGDNFAFMFMMIWFLFIY